VNYIIPVDGQADPALAEKFNLNVDDILSWLKESKFKRQVVYVDACRNRLTIRKGIHQPYIERAFKYSTGLHVMIGTKLGEYSREDDMFGHGVFTKFLLDGLYGAAADQNGLITVGYMADYVFDQMTKYSDTDPTKKQIPIIFGEGNYMIPLAVLPEGGGGGGHHGSGIGGPGLQGSGSLLDQAWDLAKGKSYDEAIDICKQVLQKEPDNLRALFCISWTYVEKGSYDEGVIYYTKYLSINPNNSVAYCNRGIAYRNRGDYADAIADFSRAIEMDPDYAIAYYSRAMAYEKKGEYEQAIADCTKAIQINPEYTQAYTERAYVYNIIGEHDSAIADCTKAIELDPGNPTAYNNRGSGYHWKGDYDLAIIDFSKAIEILPCAIYYCNRGNSYWGKKDYLSAYDDYCKAVELDPNHQKAREWRQNAYDKLYK
jgi:tetratricopeptide (TPR) repeat protein